MRKVGAAAVIGILVAACTPTSSVPAAESLQGAEDANAALPWAFVLNSPPNEDAAAADPDEIVSVPGSELSLRRADINIENGPPDWHPDDHPSMPSVVSMGGGEGVVACAYCHLPNGQGKPENAGLAGQPAEYIMQQVADYRNGRRKSSEPRMGPPAFMARIGVASSEDEARIAAEYFSSIDFKPWIRVVETDMVPVTLFAGWIHQVVEGGGTEPIGVRVVEVPEDLRRTQLRDDASSFIAYVPQGAIGRGAELVNTGGDGRTVACTICHGLDLRGLGPVPALAGRSPSYMARQLFDLQQGNRAGLWSDLMTDAVANLSAEDIVNIVAYTASLSP